MSALAHLTDGAHDAQRDCVTRPQSAVRAGLAFKPRSSLGDAPLSTMRGQQGIKIETLTAPAWETPRLWMSDIRENEANSCGKILQRKMLRTVPLVTGKRRREREVAGD